MWITIYLNDIPQGGSQKKTHVSQEDTAATPTPYADLETALSSHAIALLVLMGTAERVTVSKIYLAWDLFQLIKFGLFLSWFSKTMEMLFLLWSKLEPFQSYLKPSFN